MNILAYLQAKRQKKQQTQAYEKRLHEVSLRFPLFCKLHAVTSPDHQGAIAQSRTGDHLLIVHTPTDERPDCVCAYSPSLHRVLGFLDEGLSKHLTYAFGTGFCRDGEVEKITGGAPYPYFGCNIRLMDTQDFLEEMQSFPLIKE